jgi:hypothetical protein
MRFGVAAVLALAAGAAPAQTPPPVPGERFMVMWDSNADGVVSVEEAQARRAMIFDMFDYEGDGILSPDDYADIDAHMAEDMQNRAQMGAGQGQMAGRMQAGMSVAANDADGDGLVTLDEFLDASPAWLEGMDVNGDGVLTSADFGPAARRPGPGRDAGRRAGGGYDPGSGSD